MISIILATLVPTLAPAPAAPHFSTAPALAQDEGADEVAKKIAAAGEDVTKLLDLAKALETEDNSAGARKVYERILEVDENNETAHKALRHHEYDGKWFKSYAELSKYRREEAKMMLEKYGKVRFNDEWVPEADLPYLRMGWVKQENGEWVSPAKLAREKDIAEKQANGWKQQPDMVWLSPADQPKHFEEGLWKCGDEWLTGDAVEAYHSEIGQWWTYPGEHFIAYSTLNWDGSWRAAWFADQIYPDLVRAFGKAPEEKPVFIVLKDIAQYNDFAAGNQGAGRPATEIDGFSSLHYSYFAESNFDVTSNPPEYLGAGVAYWDRNDPAVAPWGEFAIRHAAAQSFAEGIDPSWNAISQVVSNPGAQPSTSAFWSEKRIPKWFRYGVASYCERYLDATKTGREGDPAQLRNWAIGDLLSKDDQIDELPKIFAFQLDLNDIEGSTRLIHEAGLLSAFVLDGGCAPVKEKHAAFKAAFKSGGSTEEAVAALQKALIDNEDAMRDWAGMGKRRVAKPAEASIEETSQEGSAGPAQGKDG